MKISVDKTEAARRQIDAAIRMLFSHEEPVAIHTLAMAALGILKDLASKNVQSNLDNIIASMIAPEKTKEFWNIIKRPANFLKHADNDPEALLDGVEEEINDFVLLWASLYYKESAHRLTPEMGTLLTWCIVLYPDILKGDAPFPEELLVAARQDVAAESRWDKLEIGRKLLAVARELESANLTNTPG